ncbi:MAG: lysylphosphatidylglycerol synthase domain-containing protein [Pleurocapsa sp.]
MKSILTAIKPYLRWFILGGTLFFLLKTFKDRWQEITSVRVDSSGWLMLLGALIVTLLAHIWSGWVWTWILTAFKLSLGTLKGIRVYLITNIAKYLPGNVWHFYGRITAVNKQENSLGAATLSVLLEPLLMAAAALLIGLISAGLGLLETSFDPKIVVLQIISLIAVLVGIHPRILNPIIHRLSRSKNKNNAQAAATTNLNSYPFLPFMGEMGFLVFRGMGFLLTFMALKSVTLTQIPQLISAFSFAWLFGLVVPGAPGGLGIFEATVIGLLDDSQFPTAIVLTTVAIFRVISILAEAIAAGMAYLSEKINLKVT